MKHDLNTAYVYFAQPGDEPFVLIASTLETLDKRLQGLQSGNHRILRVLGAIDMRKILDGAPLSRVQYLNLARERETEIRAKFADTKVHGKWHRLTDEIRDYIRQVSNL